MTAIAFKLLVATASGLLGAWILARPALDEGSERAFLWRVTALQLALGLGLFTALYILGGAQVTSDAPGYYMPAARAALAGKLPLRDFPTSYAPVFPYVGAALVALWNSAKAFALFAIAVNALALLAWHSAALVYFGRQAARRSSVLYSTSGHLLVQALLGTNQLWISALLGASVLLLVKRRELGSGLTQAVAICTTKFLAALFWPVLWISSARRPRWLGAALGASAAVYLAFAFAGADLAYPLRHEDGLTSPGNLPYLLEPLLSVIGIGNPHVLDGAALAMLAAATAWFYLRARVVPPENRPSLSPGGIALIGLVFMLVSKKSATGYAVFFMYPAMLVLVLGERHTRLRAGFALLFNVLLATEPSLLFHLGGHAPSGHGPSLSEWLHISSLRAGGFAALDLVLVACYAYLALLSVRCVRRVVTAAMASPSASQPVPAACSPA
jgi:hypothetical protein